MTWSSPVDASLSFRVEPSPDQSKHLNTEYCRWSPKPRMIWKTFAGVPVRRYRRPQDNRVASWPPLSGSDIGTPEPLPPGMAEKADCTPAVTAGGIEGGRFIHPALIGLMKDLRPEGEDCRHWPRSRNHQADHAVVQAPQHGGVGDQGTEGLHQVRASGAVHSGADGNNPGRDRSPRFAE